MTKKNERSTFIVSVISQDNATWQGTVTWVETNETQPFRSALELMKLIDGVLEKEETQPKEATQPQAMK